MKHLKKLFLLLTAFVTLCGAGCAQLDPLLDKAEGLLGGILGSSEEKVDSSSNVNDPDKDPDKTPDEDPDEDPDETPDETPQEYETITISEALALCGEEGNITTERYYIRATVDKITNGIYGEMTISDETGSIYVYGTYSADGSLTFEKLAEKPQKGDEVLLHCILQNHKGTKEVKNARLIEFKAAEIDQSSYKEMSVAEARNAEEGSLVKVDGVVAKITYANGMSPNGVMLVDETQSIYVFDSALAASVKIGNKITILASKTWWILEKEQTNAKKFGYKGCCQLTDVIVVSNDNGNTAFDKSWIEESTVKEIVENPVTNDITTTIYKVNALVKKVVGSGFTNYYFNDLDGWTGSYTYTQCNGKDFAWLDEFDGKICTVYLTALNAKSSSGGCVYRLLPIEVKNENFVFDTKDAAEFAVKYYGVDQFAESYMADPAKEMVTEVSSELLGIEGVGVTYSSDNESVVYFETTADGRTVFHCGELGEANVTIKASYNGVEYRETLKITVKEDPETNAITVADAIAAADDSEVVVKGIVGPSVVNRDAFYLFGEDGSMISVLVDSTAYFADLEIGHRVVIKGKRERFVNDDAATYAGQATIVNAEILANKYGEHEYSTAKFVTDKTLADFYALDGAVDYSTTVFVLEATVNYVATDRYTTLNLTDGATTVSLYCSGAGQYEWLQEFAGQKVKMEIAACNWNNKKYWRGCVLAVYTEDGKVLNTLNFDTY